MGDCVLLRPFFFFCCFCFCASIDRSPFFSLSLSRPCPKRVNGSCRTRPRLLLNLQRRPFLRHACTTTSTIAHSSYPAAHLFACLSVCFPVCPSVHRPSTTLHNPRARSTATDALPATVRKKTYSPVVVPSFSTPHKVRCDALGMHSVHPAAASFPKSHRVPPPPPSPNRITKAIAPPPPIPTKQSKTPPSASPSVVCPPHLHTKAKQHPLAPPTP